MSHTPAPQPDHSPHRSNAWLLLEGQHRYLDRPGRLTVAEIARRAGISPDKARRLFKGNPGAPANRGELPSETVIAAVAHGYQMSQRILRDAFIDDAGRATYDDPERLEAAAKYLLELARAMRRDRGY